MAYRYDAVFRLEPVHTYRDLSRGIAAEVADPAWFLGRQWQLGEHRGEDAASPVRVEYSASQVPIGFLDGLDPAVVPAEAIIESEPDDFWTAGRRVTIGRAVERAAAEAGRPLPDDNANLRLRRPAQSVRHLGRHRVRRPDPVPQPRHPGAARRVVPRTPAPARARETCGTPPSWPTAPTSGPDRPR